jgi:outer membrane lipoprotein carrier protein
MRVGRLKKKVVLGLLALILAGLFGPVVAAPAAPGPGPWPPERVLQGLSGRYRQLNAFTAAYRRVASTPATEQIFKSGSQQVATGMIYWARPDRLKLEQVSPQPELMVTDGSTVWWHLPDEHLAYRYRNVDVAGELKPLLAFLSGLDSLSRDFSAAAAPPDPARPGQHGLYLNPKAADESLGQLTLWCDETFALTGFRLASVTGETLEFFLAGLKENPPLEPAAFAFQVPDATEVIDEEEQ